MVLDAPSFLATIQVAITLSGFLGSAFAADNFSEVIVKGLLNLGLPVPKETLNTISVIVITILLSFITLVFGELVPKRLAMRKTESIALALSGTVSFISKAFSPLVWLLTASTNGVLRLLGIDPNAEDSEVSEEDIRMMADAGTEKGVINEDENNIIQNIFEFNDIYISEIMTHRTEVFAVNSESSCGDVISLVKAEGFSRVPVYTGTIDTITGVLFVKDLLGVMGDERTYDYAVALRAVNTVDFMTAEAAEVPFAVLQTVMSRIINEVRGVNRVFYDLTSKPPGTIEFE